MESTNLYLSHYIKEIREGEDYYFYSTKNGTVMKAACPLDTFDGLLNHENKQELAQYGFYVADPVQEKKQISDYVNELDRKGYGEIIVSLTSACNLSCSHCFFPHHPAPATMSKDVVDGVINFVAQNFLDTCEEIRVIAYGGEALLSYKVYVEMVKRLSSLSKNVRWNFGVQTNGILLVPSVVKELADVGVMTYGLSLDGLLHDKVRSLKNGKGTFDIIIKNLQRTLEDERIKISVNSTYSKEDYRESYGPEYFDFLCETGIAPKLASYTFSPRWDFGCGFGCKSASEEGLMEPAIAIRNHILKRGIKTPPMGAPVLCSAELAKTCFISPEGTLYKCPILTGDAYNVGDVFNGISKRAQDVLPLRQWETHGQCGDCLYLPLCYGGCRAIALANNAGIECRKEYYGKVLGDLVLQDVRYGLK